MFARKKTLFKPIFFAAFFLVFGFGILSASKVQAAAVLTVSSSRTDVKMCTKSGGTFTVKNGVTPVEGAKVTLSGGTTGECTTDASGVCSITIFDLIVTGDVSVAATKGNDTVITPLVLEKAPGASTEAYDPAYCKDNCDNDMDSLIDCADIEDCPKNTVCSTEGGRCDAAKKCTLATGDLTLKVDKTSIFAGTSTSVTFTSNYADVIVRLTGLASTDCVTSANKKCSISLAPTTSGTITATATRVNFVDSSPVTIIVNNSDALRVTISTGNTVIVGKEITAKFTVKDKDGALVEGAAIAITGAATGACTTDDTGKCSVVFTAAAAGNIDIKAAKSGATDGSLAIKAVTAGGGGGGGGGGSGGDNYGLPTDSLKVIIGRVINWLLGISASLAILFIIIGGIYYITAAGDESQIETGKKMITYAIFGLLIVGMSYAIVLAVNEFIGG